MRSFDERQLKAAAVLRAGGSLASAAQAAGVNKTTVVRWRKDPEYLALCSAPGDAPAGGSGDQDVAVVAIEGLTALVPKALNLLDQMLSGGNVSASAAREALNIIKAAAALKSETGAVGGSSLEARIAEIEARGDFESD